MSQEKKKIRNAFNLACLKRDNYKCRKCGKKTNPENWQEVLNVHHITDRHILIGGNVKENGICLCFPCHEFAEQFHQTGKAAEGFSVDELYALIGSSFEKAKIATEKLNGRI